MIEAISGLLVPVLDALFSFTHSWGIAIILFAGIAKVALIPLTNKQFKSMREMQVIQPEIKRLQDKYKDKPEIFQKEFSRLLKSRKVNPFAGCLISMVVQLPILWALYYVIRDHIVHFSQSGFLWIGNFAEKLAALFPVLANKLYDFKGFCELSMHQKPSFPYLGTSLAGTDWPLLILYGISMILFSKLNSMPSPDPQAQQTQGTMNLMMPVLSVFIFRTFPSAFILYWLVFNVFSVVHQFWFFKNYQVEPAVSGQDKRRNTADA